MTIPAVTMGWCHVTGWPYLVILLVAVLSDIFDGILARRFGVETPAIRQWDTIVDTIFSLGVLVGMFGAFPQVVNGHWELIAAIPGLEVIRYIVDLVKFGIGASYHCWSAKCFGLLLTIACIAVMGFSVPDPWLNIALSIGVISELEGLMISLIIDKWTYNIRSIFDIHAKKGHN